MLIEGWCVDMSPQVQTAEPQKQISKEVVSVSQVSPGPVEGLLIVNGRPQIERADMPTLAFESADEILQLMERLYPKEGA